MEDYKMKKINIFIAVIVLLSLSMVVEGQSKTNFFVQNSTMRHNYNVASAPDQGFVGFPALSNINFSNYGNFGASTFLYQLDNGKTGLFLNPEVGTDDFLNSLPDVTHESMYLNYDLFNAGFFTFKNSFWTIGLGVRTELNATMPKELFRFAKQGMAEGSSSNYLIEQTTINAQMYGQLYLGYSQGLDKLVKGLRVGGKLKLLVGLEDIDMAIESLNVQMGADSWLASARGKGHIYGGGINLYENERGVVDSLEFDASTLGVSGFGAAIDLGFEYRISQGTPVDGLTFSFSVVDLGFISYSQNKSTLLTNDGSNTFTYDGFSNIDFNNFDFSDQLDELKDDLVDMASFSQESADAAQVQALSAKIYAGVEYPFLKDKMRVGLLYSGKFGRYRNQHELTVAYNYAPVRWFDVALSYSFLNSQQSIGWLITFVPRKGLNIFFGSDYTQFSYSKQGIPVNKSYLDFNLGISIPLGKNTAID